MRAKWAVWLLSGVVVLAALLPIRLQAMDLDYALVIADERGDWGPLAPYLHVARGPGYVYTSFVFDTLLWKNTAGQLVPLLAEDWTADERRRCYQFTISDQARWHDGKPVTAADVAFTFDYVSRHFYRFVDTSGIERVSVSGLDVEVCLSKPAPLFLERVAGSLPILPKHIYEGVEDPQRFQSIEAMIGSGPYKVATHDRAQGFYHLVRNDQWHLGLPRYPDVVISKMSPQAAVKAMARGDIGFMNITHDFVPSFREAGAHIRETPSNHPFRLLFNHQQRFAKPLLRHGMAQAIDRQQLIELAYHGHALKARPAYRQDLDDAGLDLYPFNTDEASEQLQRAGWSRDGNGQWQNAEGQPIALRMIAPQNGGQLATVLARQLTEFGFDIKISLLSDMPLTKAVQAQDFDLALLSQSHQGDPDRFRMLLTGRHARGDQYFANRRLLGLLEQLRELRAADQRAATLLEAERLYNRDLPSLPLLNPLNYSAERPGLGAEFTPNGIAMGIPLPLNKLALFLPVDRRDR
ncbi:MAG: hypothetical protein HLX50_01610 [Alteromonadaceae bacterium]|nr:hypothetical protein [Alteromonadaceae bacterium]